MRGSGAVCLAAAMAALSVPVAGTVEPEALRRQLADTLGIPDQRVPLEPEPRGQIRLGEVTIEKWILTAEAGSRMPALLYRPSGLAPGARLPAIVLVYGHGGSKSTWEHQYAGQLYAKAGLACVAIDPIGEEERNVAGRMGSRAHDDKQADARAAAAGRLIMGKLVFDAMRAVDWLHTRGDIDTARIGVAGYSLGGATASWLTAVDPRLRMSLMCGWAYDDVGLTTKLCQSVPLRRMRDLCDWTAFVSLGAPHCATRVMNGDADVVIDRRGDGSAWRSTDDVAVKAGEVYARLGRPGWIDTWYEKGAGHRPYFLYKAALEWIHAHLGTPSWTLGQIRSLPTLRGGTYCDANGIELEALYGTDLHWRGSTLPDVGVRHLPPEDLACLEPEERGAAQFTLEGWLDQIERSAAR